MSKKDFMLAMGHIDDRILDRYMQEDERLSTPFVKRPWVRITALAACLALILTCAFWLLPPADDISVTPATITMEDILAVTSTSQLETPTSFYSKIKLLKGATPSYLPIPEQSTLSVYKNNRIFVPLDEDELSKKAAHIFSGLADAFGTDAPEYTITNETFKMRQFCQQYDYPFDLFSHAYLQCDGKLGNFDAEFTQGSGVYDLRLITYGGELQYFNGKPLVIDPRMNDAQIIAALENTKETLFAIFGESYPDIKITRRSSAYYSLIYVDFYDASDPVNQWSAEKLGMQRPLGNCISLIFDIDDDPYAAQISSIGYEKSLIESDKIYSVIDMPIRTLQEAEQWLNKGYVFGGYGCPLCMEAQTPVDFENYDFAGIHYLYRSELLSSGSYPVTVAIPFYVFYKAIESDETTTTYAYTYVPAIEIEGMEEYFEEKYSHHDTE